MEKIVFSDIHPLEAKLEKQKDAHQRVVLLDKLANHYVYTNASKAQKLLAELGQILAFHSYPDLQLNYHINTAIVENQFYNHDIAEDHLLKAIEILEDRGDISQQIETYIDYAGICINLGKLDTVTSLLDKTDRLLRTYPDMRLEARMNCREAYLNLSYTNVEKGIELFLEAEKKLLSIEKKQLGLKDYYFLTLIYSGLGNIYSDNSEDAKSVNAYLKVLDICKEMHMSTRLSWHYLNVGQAYMELGHYDLAEDYMGKAILSPDDISQSARAGAFANLGNCYFQKGKYEEALKLYNKAQDLYKQKKEEDQTENLFSIERWKAELYKNTDQAKLTRKSLIKAFSYAKKNDNARQLSIICKDISEYYEVEGDYKNAYLFQKLSSAAISKYYEEVNSRRVIEMEIKYDAEKKKQEAELLQLKAVKLQLKALRAQMNPHFMFNSLNSIQNYITNDQIDSASKYLAQFAKLMRHSLDYSDMDGISLENEIEFLGDYLKINKNLRFGKLDYKITIDDDIEEDIMCVPTMIVQPYVENAIEHGLRSQEGGLIKIDFHLHDDNTIFCTIEDNGVGREVARQQQQADEKYKNHRSLGTIITRNRLELLNNSNISKDLLVKTVDLKDEKTGEALGTRVEIFIPVMETVMK